MRVSQLLRILQDTYDHLSFCVSGPRGSYKTTHLYGMYEELRNEGFKCKFAYDVSDIDVCDCLFLDDFGTKFYKRDASVKQNKEFMKLLQEIRTNIPLIISSTPDLSLLDKDFRAFFLDAYILSLGRISVGGVVIEVNPPSLELYNAMKRKEHKRRKERFLKVINEFKRL